MIVLLVAIPIIRRQFPSLKSKLIALIGACFGCTLVYGIIFAAFDSHNDATFFQELVLATLALFTPSLFAIALLHKKINTYFLTTKIYNFMEHNQTHDAENVGATVTNQEVHQSTKIGNHSNKQLNPTKTLMKGLITAGLILVMLIPTAFVIQLVKEREKRQSEVVNEVANGWSKPQTIYGPYIYIPYQVTTKDANQKNVTLQKQLYLLPENLMVDGNIVPEVRLRSIYKVLLYRSELNTTGNFKIILPKDVDVSTLELEEAKICFNLSDYKGIEERLSINFNGNKYDFVPGLPVYQSETVTTKSVDGEIDVRTDANTKQVPAVGLSVSIPLTKEDFAKSLNFNMNLKLKGSEKLHFVPLSANSAFNIKSTWADPKFEGNSLPNYREVSKDGFNAKWSFNSANPVSYTHLTLPTKRIV